MIAYDLITQDIYVEKYDWTIHAIYNLYPDDIDVLQDFLYSINASKKDIIDVSKFFQQDKPNMGITYTNYNNRSTVFVIGYTDSSSNFINTFMHELAHVQNHISKYYNLDKDGEEVCYLVGDIAQRMSKKCSSLFCNCCRQ